MRDVALAPNYGEVFGVFAFEILLACVVIALAFTKVQFVGSIPPSFWVILTIVIVFALILAFGLLVVRWLIKSLIVKAVCNAGSNWDFRTAASITGYAYLAEVCLGF